MKLYFKLHLIPEHSGHRQVSGYDNILMVSLPKGDLWYLWKGEFIEEENRNRHYPYVNKKVG